MFEVSELTRVLCRHQWRQADEWAEAVRTLADLDDAAIAELLRDRQEAPAGARG